MPFMLRQLIRLDAGKAVRSGMHAMATLLRYVSAQRHSESKSVVVDISGKTLYVGGKTPDVSGKTPDVGGETPDVSGETPDVSGKTPDVSGKTPDVDALGMVVIDSYSDSANLCVSAPL